MTTRTAHIWLGADGIIRVKPHARLHESLEDAIENVAAVEKVALGVRRPVLIDLTLAGPQSAECRAHYMLAESNRYTKALAYVTRSLLARVVANFILGSNRNIVPMRLFENEAAAVAWLLAEQPSVIPPG